VKKLKDLQEAGINLEETTSIPIQCQISYTDLKGNEFVRIICKKQNLTKDVKEAKKDIKASILTGYVQKESADLVLKGKYQKYVFKNSIYLLEDLMLRKRMKCGAIICKKLQMR